MDFSQSLERRHYFRVDDDAIVRLTPLESQTLESVKKRIQANTPSQDNYFLGLEKKMQPMLGAVMVKDPMMAELLDLMNQKLNLVYQQAQLSRDHLLSQKPQPINLSATGFAMTAQHVFEQDKPYLVELVLMPQRYTVEAIGEVINCQLLEEGHVRASLQFSHISAHDQERLIAHVMDVEAKGIRAKRA